MKTRSMKHLVRGLALLAFSVPLAAQRAAPFRDADGGRGIRERIEERLQERDSDADRPGQTRKRLEDRTKQRRSGAGDAYRGKIRKPYWRRGEARQYSEAERWRIAPPRALAERAEKKREAKKQRGKRGFGKKGRVHGGSGRHPRLDARNRSEGRGGFGGRRQRPSDRRLKEYFWG